MEKKTLVIIPGWGGTSETWSEFVKIAQNNFDIQVIDLPCCGDEPCLETAWGVEEYADFIKLKIESYEDRKPILLGHSFGGQISAYLVANNPELVSKLILSGPAVFRPHHTVRRAVFNTIAKIGKFIFRLPLLEKFSLGAKKVLYKVADSPDYLKTSGIKTEIFKKAIRQDLSDTVTKINVPTLIIWGTLDTYVPVSDAYKLNKLIKNSKLEVIKGGKHGLHLQQPKNLLKIIYDFCS